MECYTTFLAFACLSETRPADTLLLHLWVWCSWGCCSNSTYRVTFPCNCSSRDVSQLKSFTGFLLVYDAVPCHPQFLVCPRLAHDDEEHSVLITFKCEMVQGPLTEATAVAGSFLPEHPGRPRVKLKPHCQNSISPVAYPVCLISHSNLGWWSRSPSFYQGN